MTSPPPPESSLESEEDTEEDAQAREEDESSDLSVLFFMLLLVSLFSVREKLKCIPFRKVMYALFPNTRAQKKQKFLLLSGMRQKYSLSF